MDKKKIVNALNKNRADELAAIMQYMGHHYTAEGMESPEIIDIFKKTSIDEMKHAEALAERIAYLGGTPTTTPSRILTGGTLKSMIQDNLKTENKAIADYKANIKLCAVEGDTTTRRLLEDILAQEEGHADTWETILSVRRK